VTRICFVCQAGPTEAKAVLLAASLRAYFPSDIELIAAHPPAAGGLKREVEQALSDLDVRVVPIRNSLSSDQPIGHESAALALVGGSGLGVFLESDMLAMSAPPAWPSGLGAMPASANHYERAVWEYAYAEFGLTVPPTVAPTLVTNDSTAPYYNCGTIAVPGETASWLAMTWVETAARLDEDPGVPTKEKRTHLSQLALPIAAHRLGLEITPLESKWNFPGWAWTLEGQETPYLFHYQTWERLRAEAPCREAVQKSATILPSVRRALASFPEPAA
jgi:hypothetical protein